MKDSNDSLNKILESAVLTLSNNNSTSGHTNVADDDVSNPVIAASESKKCKEKKQLNQDQSVEITTQNNDCSRQGNNTTTNVINRRSQKHESSIGAAEETASEITKNNHNKSSNNNSNRNNTSKQNNKNSERKRKWKKRSRSQRKKLNRTSADSKNDQDNIEIVIAPRYKSSSLLDDSTTSAETNDVVLQTTADSNNTKKFLRIVKPYPYTYATHAKARWINRTILDVYVDEFGSYPKIYYETCIQSGRITVNHNTVSCEYKIKGGDVLRHMVHRHEPAVLAPPTCGRTQHETNDATTLATDLDATTAFQGQRQLQGERLITYETEEVLVVNKPSTIPVHPCGSYHYNSLFHILSKLHPSLKNKLYTVHRLDRLTSGLTLIAKSSAVAKRLGESIMAKKNSYGGCTAGDKAIITATTKVYLARVKGKFPLDLDKAKIRRLTSKDCEGDSSMPCHYGEWTKTSLENTAPINSSLNDETKKSNDQIKPPKLTTSKSSSIPALGYWIANGTATDDIQSVADVSLEDVFQNRTNNLQTALKLSGLLSPPEKYPTLSSDDNATRNISQQNYPKNVSNSKIEKMSFLSQKRKLYWLHLACPTRIAQHKNGICEAGDFSQSLPPIDFKSVKPAQTSILPISYSHETNTTLVLVKPQTGRTHQIRLHLQYLNHAIANDVCYGGESFYGNQIGRLECERARECLDRMDQEELVTIKVASIVSNEKAGTGDAHLPSAEEIAVAAGTTVKRPKDATSTDIPATEDEILALQQNQSTDEKDASMQSFIKRTCVWCARAGGGSSVDRARMEFLVRSQSIWLHALRYRIDGVWYSVDLPEWGSA